MRILLASPRGFCAGVNMAILCLEECIRVFGTDIYVYHEIVHNKWVVDALKARGARAKVRTGGVVPRRPRFRLVGFFVRMCRRNAFERLMPPLPRMRKRLAAPLLVFIFGMVNPLLA